MNKSKDIPYFAHDINARNDDRILQLRSEFGNETGYALWFMLCEIMAEAADGTLNPARSGGYSISLGVPREQLAEFINRAIELELLYTQPDGLITSKRMQQHKETRRAMSMGARNARAKATKPTPTAPATQGGTVLDIPGGPLNLLNSRAQITMDAFRLKYTQPLNKKGVKFDDATDKWQTSIMASDIQINPDPQKQIEQLTASLRRYLISWTNSQDDNKTKTTTEQKTVQA